MKGKEISNQVLQEFYFLLTKPQYLAISTQIDSKHFENIPHLQRNVWVNVVTKTGYNHIPPEFNTNHY